MAICAIYLEMNEQLLPEVKDPQIQSVRLIHDYESDRKCNRCKECDHSENSLYKLFSVEYSTHGSRKLSCYKCCEQSNGQIEFLCVSGFCFNTGDSVNHYIAEPYDLEDTLIA